MVSSKSWILSFLVFFSFSLFAQEAKIYGIIKDNASNELLIGAKVIVKGQPGVGAVSDENGKYIISNVKPGNIILEIRFETYKTRLLDEFTLKNDELKEVNIELEKLVIDRKGITVTKKVNKESTTELIRMQKNSATVVDGMNAETFKKTPDSKASDVLKRISGASVQDNKFVVIRGLSDRYNFALLNGASLPSSESDRKAFSFDIFPSNMLDNLLITKTATPELPGEFAGGVIDINTSEPKETNFQNIQIGASYNSITTFKDFRSYNGGNADFLGLGSGARAIPEGLPTTEQFNVATNAEKADLAKLIKSDWGSFNRKALPNLSLQYSIGRMIQLKEKRKLGYVFAYSYQNNFSFSQVTRREFEEQTTGVITKNELRDSAFTQAVLNSGMFNISYSFNDKNKIQLKNMYSISTDDKVNVRNGKRDMDIESVYSEKSTNFWYTQNNLFTSQLIGNHELKNKLKLKWVGSFSDVKREIPFLRRTVYQQVDTTLPFFAVVQSNDISTLGAGNMFWSDMNEKIFNVKYDVAYPFELGKFKNEAKIGAFHQYRTRTFAARNLGFSKYDPSGSANFESSLLLLPADEIFASENMGLMANGQGGFKLEEGTNVDDSYQAYSLLNAGFLQLDSKLGDKFRLVGGARVEAYNQVFKYVEFGSNLPRTLDTTVVDLLPSVNLIYSPIQKINIRASYSRTLSRPEFRELAPFAFYNFLNDNLTSGDPNLQRALINNYDLRFEFFPGAGQIISLSGFYKQFYNPIELLLRTGTSGTPELYYDNVGNVVNYGAEVEYRINLGTFSKKDSSSFLKNFTLYFNGALIRSQMDLGAIAGLAEYPDATRPLQGQSPYLINAGIFYAGPKDFNVNISYNLVGQRIAIAGSIQEPSVWENGRNVIDFQLSKVIKKILELKLNVKDVLAQDLVFFQDTNKNKKYDKGIDSAWQEITFGQTISLSLKYNF
ncbi:MAG: TonB-dependent receptor domain-containing protein [Crocinitomicaceae bacterium]